MVRINKWNHTSSRGRHHLCDWEIRFHSSVLLHISQYDVFICTPIYNYFIITPIETNHKCITNLFTDFFSSLYPTAPVYPLSACRGRHRHHTAGLFSRPSIPNRDEVISSPPFFMHSNKIIVIIRPCSSFMKICKWNTFSHLEINNIF